MGFANGASTLTFSNTSIYASNWANGLGTSVDPAVANGTRMVWGIVVDAGGDGFDATPTNPYANNWTGGTLTGNNSGLQLSTTTNGTDFQLSDDVLYISSAVMGQTSATNTGVDGGTLAGTNRVLGFSNMNYNAGLGVATGDAYAIIWFDSLVLGSAATEGLKYGLYNFGDTLPADPPGGAFDKTAFFAGPDELKTMTMALNTAIPEPSAALLGALGVLGLLRRRRN